MNKALTLSQRCSSKMLTEQLTQQQLYIRLIAKLFMLLMSVESLSNLFNMLTHMSTLSNIAETRTDKGFHKDAQMSNLIEHLDIDQPLMLQTSALSMPVIACTATE